MDPINPWIDPGETRRMAERLMLPSREPVSAPEDTGFDDAFVGFSDADPETDIQGWAGEETQTEDADAPEDAATGEPTHSNGDNSGDEDDEAPGHGDPAHSKHHEMLREKYSAVASFMLNSKGEVAFDEGGFDGFHFILRDLVKSGAEPVQMRVKVGAGMFLEIIPMEDGDGCSWLGVVVPSRLGNVETGLLE